MSMLKTLATVAAGAMVARGVGQMVNRRTGGGGGAQQGGLGGMLGGMLGGAGGQQGGLGGALGGMLGGGQQGGLGGALGGMLGGGGAQQGGQAGGMGGLAGMLGGALAGKGTQGGGLGGLLESLSGGAAPGQVPDTPPQPNSGSLGGMLNDAFENFGQEPAASPTADQEAQAQLLLRAMISAAKSDGQIDAAEREKLLGHLGDASAAEVEFVKSELAAPLDLESLVRDVPQGMEQQVYLMSLMAIDLDQQSEAQYLDGLARAMNLNPEICNAIHDKLGAPRLYS